MTNREVIRIVQIDQPLCARRYGDSFQSPTGGCTAQLGVTGTRKCFNTRATCQDPSNYSPGTLTLSFAENQLDLLTYDNVIPSILSLDTTPGEINLGGMDRSASALGQREVVSIQFTDHQHSDLQVDPYRLERETGEASLVHEGTATGGSPANDNSHSLELASDASEEDDAYVGMTLSLVSGAGSSQSRTIVNYDGTAQRATVGRWSSNKQVRSQEFDNASWTKDGVSVTANAITAPDGTTTADSLVEDSSSGVHHVFDGSPFIQNSSNTFSCFIKAAGRTRVNISFSSTYHSPNGSGATFDLSAGTVLSTTDASARITAVGGGWYRCEVTGVCTGVSANYNVFINAHNGISTNYAGSNGLTAYYLWGAQAEPGEVATDYIATTSAEVTYPDGTTGYQILDAYRPHERGTFWGKWLARNPYHSGYALRVYEGDHGDDLADMRVRHYVIDRIDGPAGGKVKLTAKDFFSHLEKEKAVAPAASLGELQSGITAASASFVVEPAGIGSDYPALGYVAIGDEIIRFTRSGDTFTVVTRGALNTTAEAHDAEDLVQLVLEYVSQLAVNIVHDLICNYTALGNPGSPTESPYINKAEWDTVASSLTGLYTARIAEPTPVYELIGELAEQVGFSVWPNIRTGMIEFRPLRRSASVTTLTDDDIVADSFSRAEKTSERVSQAWIYYGQINPIEDLDDRRNFNSRFVSIDADAEDSTEYGVPAIKEFFSRWIPQFGRSLAESVADRHVAIFRDPPYESRLRLHVSREGEFELASYVTIETADVQDDSGVPDEQQYAIIGIERDEHEIELTARSITLGDFAEADNDRTIYIENSSYNLNLRTIHDSIYAAPIGGSPTLNVNFIIEPGVIVGSTSTSMAALVTGGWPAGVNLSLENRGRIQGKGGAGGSGSGGATGSNGATGGTALQATYAITVDNEDGEIWAGGGGGGGGGGFIHDPFLDGLPYAYGGGGGGGGGAGTDGGGGGAPGPGAVADGMGGAGVTGGTGSASSGASGGIGYSASGVVAGTGGTGGGPGLDGSTGNSATGSNISDGSGFVGGSAGDYINGNSFVTWAANGDRRGGVA